MASTFYSVNEGYHIGRLWAAFAESEKDVAPKPDPKSTTGNVFAYFNFAPDPLRSAAAGHEARCKVVFEPDTTFQWPGGSYDPGEIPKGKIYGFTIYDPQGNALLMTQEVMLTFDQLRKAAGGLALERLVLRGDDLIENYEGAGSVHGWAGDDRINFYTLGATGYGGDGADTIYAKHNAESGISRLFGEKGADTLHGSDTGDGSPGTGVDRLDGGAGKDELFGYGGDDILTGGKGDDTMTGGEGADIFRFGTGDGHDTILDFKNGADRLDLSAWKGMADFADVLEHAAEFDGDLVISLGKDSVTLSGVDLDNFHETDVLF